MRKQRQNDRENNIARRGVRVHPSPTIRARAVQEFRRELDDAIVSKFQEDDDAMQVEDLDLMQQECY